MNEGHTHTKEACCPGNLLFMHPPPTRSLSPSGLDQIKQADNFLSKLYNNLMSLHNFATTVRESSSCGGGAGVGCGVWNDKKARKLGPKASQLDDDKDNGKSHYSVY